MFQARCDIKVCRPLIWKSLEECNEGIEWTEVYLLCASSEHFFCVDVISDITAFFSNLAILCILMDINSEGR